MRIDMIAAIAIAVVMTEAMCHLQAGPVNVGVMVMPGV